MNFVRDAFVEFDGSNVCVQVESAAKAENDGPSCEVAVRKMGSWIADGSQKDGVGLIFAEIKGAFRPFFSRGFVVFTATRNDRLNEPVIGVFLDGIENALGFKRYFSARPVAWQNRDAMVTHASSHMTLLHERDPFHRTKKWFG